MNSVEFRGVLPIADAPIEVIKQGQPRAAANRAPIYVADGGAVIDQDTYVADEAGAFRFYCEDRVDIYYGSGLLPQWVDVLVTDIWSPTPVTDLGVLDATLKMDMVGKSRALFTATASATTLTISIANPPATGSDGEATVLLDTTTLPASITFPAGTVDAPTITVGTVWELNFRTVDGGTTWRVIGKEWTA